MFSMKKKNVDTSAQKLKSACSVMNVHFSRTGGYFRHNTLKNKSKRILIIFLNFKRKKQYMMKIPLAIFLVVAPEARKEKIYNTSEAL